jgi:hypothetical protein
VTLLHDDDVLEPGALAAVVATAERHPEVAVQLARVGFIDAKDEPCGDPAVARLFVPFVPTGVPSAEGRCSGPGGGHGSSTPTRCRSW